MLILHQIRSTQRALTKKSYNYPINLLCHILLTAAASWVRLCTYSHKENTIELVLYLLPVIFLGPLLAWFILLPPEKEKKFTIEAPKNPVRTRLFALGMLFIATAIFAVLIKAQPNTLPGETTSEKLFHIILPGAIGVGSILLIRIVRKIIHK